MSIFCYSRDILHKWVYPLSIESGLYSRDKYTLTGNLNFVENSAMLSRYGRRIVFCEIYFCN